jgi:uncharacterized membrane protein YbhN (UPF0104 family)
MGVLLPLTPGALGIVEGAIAGAGHAWALPLERVLSAALVCRAVGVCLAFALGTIFSHVLLGRAFRQVQEPEETSKYRP